MSVYIVCYDLNTAGKDYEELIDAIKAYGSYCKLQLSTWFIDTAQTAAQVRDNLKQHLDKNDELWVGDLRKHWAGFISNCTDWLKNSNRTWAS